jgi:uncharacterized protein YcbX
MQITALNIYPIKGCRGIPLERVDVDRLGLAGDRRLMLVDADNRFISQRECPGLATIVPAFAGNDTMVVTAPGRDALTFEITVDGPSRVVRVWSEHPITAADQGDAVSQWFSDVLAASCRLVAFGKAATNPVDAEYTTDITAETAFTDGYPIMATLQESLDSLNVRLDEPVPMERFRPSVVISGANAWSEDDWMTMKLGELYCDAVKPCARCVVTTTDQRTGARALRQEPLRTLATFRTIPGLGAIFGQNIIARGTGVLRVGDAVELM